MGWENARRIFRAAWIACLIFAAVCASTPATAAAQGTTQPTTETRAALLERDVADLRANAPLALQASKDVTHVEAQQHEVSARIDDLKARIGDLTIAISLFAPFLTILAVLVGLAAYSAAGQRAEAAAKAWMKEQGARLLKRIDELEGEAEKIAERMHQQEQDVVQRALGAKGRIDDEADTIMRLQNKISAEMSPGKSSEMPEQSVDDRKTMKQVNEALKAKPEKDYTEADWATRAFAAYSEKDFERSAFYFQQAAEASSESPIDWARNTFNRCVVLGEAGRHADALAAGEAVLERFGRAPEMQLSEWVAGALVNKGVALGQLNRGAEELAVYDAVVAQFGVASDATLRVWVARARFNKAVALQQLERPEEAIPLYDGVVTSLRDATEIHLRDLVAKAIVNKGAVLGSLDRNEEAIAAYNDVVLQFGTASEVVLLEQVAKALGNKGRVLTFLGRWGEAIAAYDEIVTRLGTGSDPVLKKLVSDAIDNRNLLKSAEP